MKLNKNIRKGMVFGVIVLISFFVFVSFTGRLYILDTDAIVIDRPNTGTNMNVSQEFTIAVIFDPTATSVGGLPYCHAYQIVLEHQRIDYQIEVVGVSGLNKNTPFVVTETVAIETVGEYRLVANFVVEDMTYAFDSGVTHLTDSVISEYSNKQGTEFYNEIYISIGSVSIESSTENTEPFTWSTTEEEEAFGFPIIALMSLPIIIYWRKFNEEE